MLTYDDDQKKADTARSILERTLGSVTRVAGECLQLPDDEAIKMVEEWGYVWTDGHWFDAPFAEMIRESERNLDIPDGTLPASFIWGDD